VALQGTLDTFALADVLRLLASTKKTGRLRVTGDRGSGSVWVADGRVVGTELAVPGTPDDGPAFTIYALLRFSAGSFTFESGATTPKAGAASDVELLLGEAEMLLAEWRSIEAVIPSLESWISLRGQLDSDVVVDAPRWRVIAAVAGGASAGSVAETLGGGEIEVLRSVKELVELGLVEVGAAPAMATVANLRGSDTLHSSALHASDRDPAPPSLAEMRSGLGSVNLSHETPGDSTNGAGPGVPHFDEPTFDVSSFEPEPERPGSLIVDPPTTPPPTAAAPPAMSDLAPPPAEPPASVSAFAPPTGGEPSLDDAAEIARQLANLSPRAAKAVAAAAKATTEEEREAALAAIEAEDDTVNRGLLLRFLGSVDS
jgi:hypothetical protein